MIKRIPYVVLVWLLVDLYFFQAVATLSHSTVILWFYWLFDALLAGCILYAALTRRVKLTSWLMALMLLSLLPKIFALPVLLLEDISRLFMHFPPRHTWVSALALVMGAIPLFALLYGMALGRHRYKVHRVNLVFDHLPPAFDGFTITQLSDIHAGSFTSKSGVEKGIALVNAQNSDLLLFTGDLVNNQAAEMDNWINAFSKLSAPFGKYAVLGNHDYGDYMKWPSEQAKITNLERLEMVHREIGFRLLLDEAVEIVKDGQSVSLIGVENWGKGGFHKYGDLEKATGNVSDDQFKILMSHDPSHWEAKTLQHEKRIDLTLAGHTHGMQFGIELFGFKWSPVKYVYPQWAGLYQNNGKYLYVNRGFGFLGFKGRVGIWPEITVITLRKS